MPEGYSATARDFVRSCLNKNPMKRYTYSMLLNHPWLKALSKAEAVIVEADESDTDSDNDSDSDDGGVSKDVNNLSLGDALHSAAGDAEVAAWVTKVLKEHKDKGDANGASNKPALHAAPLAP